MAMASNPKSFQHTLNVPVMSTNGIENHIVKINDSTGIPVNHGTEILIANGVELLQNAKIGEGASTDDTVGTIVDVEKTADKEYTAVVTNYPPPGAYGSSGASAAGTSGYATISPGTIKPLSPWADADKPKERKGLAKKIDKLFND